MIGSEVINDLASRDRDIAMVFQSYALYPHLSVFDNIAFPLQIARRPKAEIAERVHDVAKILQLENYLKRKPGGLSGGQRQRVAMGRAIIRRPAVFLMDEPLSNLDAKLRVQMRSEIAQIQRRLKVTTVYVTHDQVEAMTMGDRVALMRDGVLQQIDTPDAIYHNPANTFVASFIGSPAMNLFHANLVQDATGLTVKFGEQSLRVTSAAQNRHPGLAGRNGAPVIVGIRPENINDLTLVPNHPADQIMTLPLRLVESLGSDRMAHLVVPAKSATVASDDADQMEQIAFDSGSGQAETAVCIARFGALSRCRAGETVRAAVSCDALHFFDPATGQALT